MEVLSRFPTRTVEVIACDKCKCTWLYKIQVNRYSVLPSSPNMTPAPMHSEADFYLLACPACNNIVFPPIEGFQTQTLVHRLYTEMTDEIVGSQEKLNKKLLESATQKTTVNTPLYIPEKK